MLDPTERALYEQTYFGRGLSTVSLAGIFSYAHDLHIASLAIGRLIAYKKGGLSTEQQSSREAILRMAQALVTRERNEMLDKFTTGWKADPGSLDHTTNGDDK